jgi:predicted permease
MDWLRTLLSRLVALFRRRNLDADLDDELGTHLELAIAENMRSGMCPEEARTAALRAFGGVSQVREDYRVQRGFPGFERVVRDIRLASRSLRNTPGFALTAILTLAFGIGAVASVFSVVDAVLLRPFAFRDPDRLVVLREVVENEAGRSVTPNNYRHILRLKNTSKTLEDVAIFAQHGASVSLDGNYPHVTGTIMASPNLFRILGVEPILGRGFVDDDARKGANPVVVLSYSGWQDLFAGDPNAVGKTLQVFGQPATVIGVLPRGMQFPQIALAPTVAFQDTASGHGISLFLTAAPTDRDLTRDMGNFNYKSIARLKPGVSVPQARAELEGLQNAYSASAHLPLRFGIALVPMVKDVAGPVSGALWLLFAAVGAVLLIACVNLGNLQLARAVNAERETAVRAALGASRSQLVCSRLMESLLLAAIGGTTGAALAFGGVRLFAALAPAGVPRLDEVHVNTPVLLFAAVTSITAAIAFGILPALRSLRVHPQAAMQGNSARTVNTRGGTRTRSIMVGGQVACTVVLLIITSLAISSFSRLMRQSRGFDSSHITMAQVDLFTPTYDKAGSKGNAIRLAAADRMLASLRQLPGVEATALTSVAPLTGETWVDNIFRPDHPVPAGKEPRINVRWIDQNYLPTMHTRLVSGRNFTVADRANPYVALISERTAREAFPGEEPIGRTIVDIVPDDKRPVTIVGVVEDARINGLKDEAAMLYLPYWAYTPYSLALLVRSSQSSEALIPEIRRAVWQIDPQVAMPILRSLDDQVSESAATDRFQAVLFTSFGAAALLLAVLGIYGVLAYSVSLRRQEFGIRMALGSGKQALVGLVLRQAAYPVLLGTGAGLASALFLLRWVRALFYHATTADPISLTGSVLLLLCAAAMAAIVPARRAASIDPMRALRID